MSYLSWSLLYLMAMKLVESLSSSLSGAQSLRDSTQCRGGRMSQVDQLMVANNVAIKVIS